MIELRNTSPNEIMEAEEVAELLRVSVDWVYSHSNGNRHPQLPSKKFGRLRRWIRSEILVSLDRRSQGEFA